MPSILHQNLTWLTLPVPQVFLVLSSALGLASALWTLHALGYAHCDVKPSNVMLRADGVPVLIALAAATPFGRRPG